MWHALNDVHLVIKALECTDIMLPFGIILIILFTKLYFVCPSKYQEFIKTIRNLEICINQLINIWSKRMLLHILLLNSTYFYFIAAVCEQLFVFASRSRHV